MHTYIIGHPHPPIEKGSNVEHEIENERKIDVSEIGPHPRLKRGATSNMKSKTKAKLMLMYIQLSKKFAYLKNQN